MDTERWNFPFTKASTIYLFCIMFPFKPLPSPTIGWSGLHQLYLLFGLVSSFAYLSVSCRGVRGTATQVSTDGLSECRGLG